MVVAPAVAVAAMTIEEKASLLTGATGWTTTAVERVGADTVVVADGPHGVRRPADLASFDTEVATPATCFPTASALASSWDPDLVHEVGRAIGVEARALGVDVLLGPGVNIKRSPLCGRNFEYFSEDPYLAGELAVGYIDGVQSQGVGTSLKHFAVNNQETRRFTVDAQVDERSLREIYLPAFEAAVKRSRPWTVMCAYNSINGTLGSEHSRLLTEILRGEWGFDGLVMSDWGAVRDRVAAVRAGLDLEMPGPRPHRVAKVVEAVRSGRLDVSVVDAAAERVLGLGARVAARRAEEPEAPSVDAHHALARRAAAESMVLLKNDGILPLHHVRRIAVVGRTARFAHYQGSGSSHITPTRLDEPLAELARLATGAEVVYAEGYPEGAEVRPDLIDEAVLLAQGADVVVVFAGLPAWKEVEGADRTDIGLPAQQVALIRAVTEAQPRTVVVLNNGSAVATRDWEDGAAAILEAWMMGQAGGGAVADLLFGRVNPSGRLAETFPLRLEDTPAYLSFPGDGDVVRYDEGLYVGYRWYDARALDVSYPFGHGLSYTSFGYSDVEASRSVFGPGDGVAVSVTVTNTGPVAGRDVVQVYVHAPDSPVSRAAQELRGFAKVALEPGESERVTVELGPRAFQRWEDGTGWVTDRGRYELRVGSSSRDIHSRVEIDFTAPPSSTVRLSRYSPLGDWLGDPDGRPIVEELLEQLGPDLARTFGASADDPSKPSAMGLTMLAAMPLPTIIAFTFATSPDSPYGDDVADALLARLGSAPHADPA